MPKGTCNFPNCDKYDSHLRRGLCHNCYERMRRAGHLEEFQARPKKIPTWDRMVKIGWTETDSGCWEWRGTKNADGYGTIFNGTYGKNKSPRRSITSRVSWEHHYGPIPEGLLVCHTCDNPPCIRPDHLFLGAPRVNSHDMVNKRRSTNGERNPNAKLTDREVQEIREKYRPRYGALAQLGREYGVTRSAIWQIINNRSRKDKTWTSPV